MKISNVILSVIKEFDIKYLVELNAIVYLYKELCSLPLSFSLSDYGPVSALLNIIFNKISERGDIYKDKYYKLRDDDVDVVSCILRFKEKVVNLIGNLTVGRVLIFASILYMRRELRMNRFNIYKRLKNMFNFSVNYDIFSDLYNRVEGL